MKLLITGGDGYLGNTLYESLSGDHNVTKISRKDFDLTDKLLTYNFFADRYFDVVLHCAIGGGIRVVKDSPKVLDDNIRMYYNLLDCRKNFDRFLNFGSGAEIFSKHTPYGLSKHVISNSVSYKEGFYNLRIFGLFDENELESRFIKSNLRRYINKQDMIVHKNKKMDFFYMEDLVSLVKYYIKNPESPKEVDCVYEKSNTLLEIVEMINNLSNYRVKISQESKETDVDYVGKYTQLPVKFVGIEKGILNVYNKLK